VARHDTLPVETYTDFRAVINDAGYLY